MLLIISMIGLGYGKVLILFFSLVYLVPSMSYAFHFIIFGLSTSNSTFTWNSCSNYWNTQRCAVNATALSLLSISKNLVALPALKNGVCVQSQQVATSPEIEYFL